VRNVKIFISCATAAIIAAILYLSSVIPRGEGAFGIAKIVPLLFALSTLVFFYLTWFPVSLASGLVFKRKTKGNRLWDAPTVFSGILFIFALGTCGHYVGPLWFYRVQFHERLEDQFGKPVAGPTVKVFMRRDNGLEVPEKQFALKSDANGFFDISCRPTESFSFLPVKMGYALASASTSGAYSDELRKMHSSASLPIVIKMWKMQGGKPLVGIDKTNKLHYTAAPIYFDLIAGQTVPSGGDLKITVNRPAGVISGRNPQDWSIDVVVADGGFIETSPGESAMTYAAPESGYQPNGTFGKNNGPNLVDKTFFIQSRIGQVYSKVHLLFGINDTPDGFMYVTFSGVASTNGSRNWEATAPQQ
jgi:hypothetical protein